MTSMCDSRVAKVAESDGVIPSNSQDREAATVMIRIAIAFSVILFWIAPCHALEEIKDCAVCPEMIALPAGQFMMGSNDKESSLFDEKPAHRVRISKSLAVGRFEVTFDEWDACVADGGCRQVDDENWGAAVDLQSMLTTMPRRPMRGGYRRKQPSATVCFRKRSGSTRPALARTPRGIGEVSKTALACRRVVSMPTHTISRAS